MRWSSEPKTEKGYISLVMSLLKDILGIGVGLWSSSLVEISSLTHLSLVNSKKDILLDIPRYMYPFSVFGSEEQDYFRLAEMVWSRRDASFWEKPV